MHLSAHINSRFDQHTVVVQTNDIAQEIRIPPKPSGLGLSVNGGELLLLSLATCFCNDLYREAGKRNISVSSVDVVCTGEFGAEGEPGASFTYTAHVVAEASPDEIEALIRHTDRVAEIHNTLRQGIRVTLAA